MLNVNYSNNDTLTVNTKNSLEPCIYLDFRVVYPIYYEKCSGEVSYRAENSTIIYTCFDYELFDAKGNDHLRNLLNELPEKSTN